MASYYISLLYAMTVILSFE